MFATGEAIGGWLCTYSSISVRSTMLANTVRFRRRKWRREARYHSEGSCKIEQGERSLPKFFSSM